MCRCPKSLPIQLNWLVNKLQHPPFSAFPALGFLDMHHHASFYLGVGILNLGLHAYAAITSLTHYLTRSMEQSFLVEVAKTMILLNRPKIFFSVTSALELLLKFCGNSSFLIRGTKN